MGDSVPAATNMPKHAVGIVLALALLRLMYGMCIPAIPCHRDNLDADFAPWTNRRYNVRQLYELVATLVKGRPQKYLSLVVIKKNRVGWLPLAARPMALTLSRVRRRHHGGLGWQVAAPVAGEIGGDESAR